MSIKSISDRSQVLDEISKSQNCVKKPDSRRLLPPQYGREVFYPLANSITANPQPIHLLKDFTSSFVK